MLLRPIYSSLWFSLNLERVVHATIRRKKKKKNLWQIFMSLKCQTVCFCIELRRHEPFSPHVAQFFQFTQFYISVYNVGSWTFSFLEGWSVFFHTQTALPSLKAGAGLDIRRTAAAELWIWGGFLCFLQVLKQHSPSTCHYIQ